MEGMPKDTSELPTLYVMVGLPRSGKTTEALRSGLPVVNADSIHTELHGQVYRAESNPLVWAIVRIMVGALFRVGHKSVVVDGCHGAHEYRRTWISSRWATRYVCVGIEDDGRPGNLELCKVRAIETGQPDLIKVIQSMYERWEPLCPEERVCCIANIPTQQTE